MISERWNASRLISDDEPVRASLVAAQFAQAVAARKKGAHTGVPAMTTGINCFWDDL